MCARKMDIVSKDIVICDEYDGNSPVFLICLCLSRLSKGTFDTVDVSFFMKVSRGSINLGSLKFNIKSKRILLFVILFNPECPECRISLTWLQWRTVGINSLGGGCKIFLWARIKMFC